MSVRIIPFTKGISKSYLVKGDDYALVDTGINISKKGYEKIFNQLQIRPEEVKTIIITHGHIDHFAGISTLQKMTGAKIICHTKALESLETGRNQDIIGRNFMGRIQAKLFNQPVKNYNPVKADILIENDYDLNENGLSGKIICTPGHTNCSLSVVFDSGESICGDMVAGPSKKPSLSPFAVNEQEMIQSIHKLMDMKIEKNYCGHGGPFIRKNIQRMLDKIV